MINIVAGFLIPGIRSAKYPEYLCTATFYVVGIIAGKY